MGSSSSSSSSSGIGFAGLLTIAFIVLKLTNVIDWSWWWVLSPMWIGAALILGIMGIVALVVIISGSSKRKKSNNNRFNRR
jgi:hypothetical protein